ncbi:hypothetical protein BV25DRAFT_1884659 [Artomyces pyxidatus]|uniref:Uncharacterized protein n=1 Tax=Artomyces pyxidatus TaxID=48021 RepID=A0ACB8T2L0_9AGAM|nr:hypothetical protein BV25DRAFT_1884659 [Artomyces pyxidatus]
MDPDLSSNRVTGWDSVFYVPAFVTEEEEDYLIRKIQETPQNKWKQLANRRLQIWGGDLTPKNVLIPQAMPPFLVEYPNLISRLKATGAFNSSPHQQPNHVILNEYLAGQGIMPHEDGPSYHPVVATLSLGSHTVMHYYRYAPSDPAEGGGAGRAIEPAPALSLLLEPRSLVITSSALYSAHLHGISAVEEDTFTGPGDSKDSHGFCVANANLLVGAREKSVVEGGGALRRGTRYSLTCRDVSRVAKIGTGTAFGR